MLPETLSGFLKNHNAKIVSFGIPVDANSSHLKGTDMAPWEIKKAMFSNAHNSFSETGVDLTDSDKFSEFVKHKTENEVQIRIAKLTGNYKRGNEKKAKNHLRNQEEKY